MGVQGTGLKVEERELSLNVDDFGAVPDGRFLERVSIGAGSAVLTDPDSSLRATDVGKSIAIPGAVDLVATIAALVERREVRNASMDAGSRILAGTLFNPNRPGDDDEEPFRADLHAGLRITVAGAGPGASTLVSDVTAVIDPTTIELADAASATVAGVEVILNRPDRVRLSNYARRSVTGVTVDLGDRVIDDGRMTIGGRGLVSETARFSSLDLGKQVTIRAAGLLVTTIRSFESPTQVTLAAPAQHAVESGLADVFQTDSRPGLERLLAALESLDVESAEIRFGSGVYDFTRTPNGDNNLNAAIELSGLRNLTFRGSGPGATILRLMPNQDLSGPDTHVIETRDCTNLTLRDLSVHGAYLTMGNTNEQMHGIHINQGSEEIVVERVRVFQSAGDGIRFLGSPNRKVRKVWVDGCQFIQNKRTGVGFQRGVEFIWVRNCFIEMTPPSTDACVDFEPTGDAAPSDIIIDSNFMVHDTPSRLAVSIAGIRGSDPARRIEFSNNVVLGGGVFCIDVDQLTIRDNVVLIPEPSTGNRILIQVQRGGDSLLVTGNLLLNENPGTTAVIGLSEVNRRQVTRAIIANNLCFARSGNGIQIFSSDDVAVEANMVVATGSCANAIFVRSETSGADNISIRNNDVTIEAPGSWITGIRITAAGNQVHHLSVVANSIAGATEGVRFQGSDFEQTPVCALNRVAAGVTSPLLGLAALPEQTLVAGGAASRGGSGPGSGSGRVLVGQGNPEGRVIGNAGDLFQRVDAAPGARLFVKESDEQPNAGWVAK